MSQSRRRFRICMASKALFALLAFFCATPSSAQDAHYWTNQYGNEGRLLGGAVVGSSKDVSAVFYNPGRLSLISDPALVLAGNVIRFTSIGFADALGEDLDLSSSRLGGVPSLFAGEIRIDEPGGHRLAYSFLTRHDFALKLEQRADISGLVSFPTDVFDASVSLRETMNEYWAGLTWSYPLSENLGLGASVFASFRDQNSRSLTLAQAQAGQDAGIALQRNDFDYLHIGLLAKLGIGADLGNWRAGLTLTTPNLKIQGSGNYGYDESVVSQDLNNDGTENSLIISEYQEGVAAEYKSPTSVALGAGYTWKKTNLDFTVEWFDKVGAYRVLDVEPISNFDGSEVRETDLLDQRKSVVNWGVGLEQVFSERVNGYLSFRTDKNSADGEGFDRVNVSVWDIYHFAGGASFPVGASSFTIGLVFATGNDNLGQGVDLVPDDVGGDEIALPDDIKVTFTRLTFILGFSISFGSGTE